MKPIKLVALALTVCSAMATAIPARAGLAAKLMEKRHDAGAFDLTADPATQAKTYVDGTKLGALKGLKRVVISSFQVEFAVENSASTWASAMSKSVATAKSSVMLMGIENPTFQKITDDCYDKLVVDLTAAGIEVLPYEKLQDSENFLIFKSRLRPSAEKVTTQDGKSLYFSPHDMPAYFLNNDGRLGKLSLLATGMTVVHPQNYEPGIAKDLDAAVLRVRMVVDIARQSTSGGIWAASAKVESEAELSIMAEFTSYTLVMPHDGTAVLSLAKHVNSAEQVFEVKGTKGEIMLFTTPEVYTRVVNAHLDATQAMFLSVLKANL